MSKRSLTILATMSIVSLAAAGAHAGPNLVVNGGFEQHTADSSGYASFETDPDYNPGGGSLTGWTETNVGVNGAFNVLFAPSGATSVEPDTRFTPPRSGDVQYLWALPGNPDPNGGYFIALDGDTQYNGALQQTISGLTVGKTYALKFYWAASQFADRSGPTTEQLQIQFGDQSAATAVVDNASHSATNWMTENFTFKADSASALLSFLSVGTPNGLPPVALLDGVSVSAVPEPSTWALITVALGGVGAAARARRRQAAIAA
jgi:hypothetical protein